MRNGFLIEDLGEFLDSALFGTFALVLCPVQGW